MARQAFIANSTLRLLCAKGGGTACRDGGIVLSNSRFSLPLCHTVARKAFIANVTLAALTKEVARLMRDGCIVFCLSNKISIATADFPFLTPFVL